MTDRVEGSTPGLSGAAASARLRLAARDGETVPQHSAPGGPLSPDASLSDAIAATLSNCLNRFSAHAAGLRQKYDAEAVHQTRVALRRLRALLGVIRSAVPCAARGEISARAKEVASALGAARDWDVLCEELQRDAGELAKGEPALYALLDAAELRRFKAQDQARLTIASPATQAFEAQLREFIARRGWLEGAEGIEEDGSARAFSAKALHRLHRRAGKRCAEAERASPEELHRARIAVKKLRYAAELFQELFPGAKVRAYLRGLAKTQEHLGAANDLETARRLLSEVAEANNSQQCGVAVKFLQEMRARRDRKIIRSARGSDRRFRRLEPFWS
ncbi:MAG TPA: CHAD domain-containing protein [Methylocystis sp.]|nr:CHAD domain-containing protein [Methylocystis sp.]